VTGPGETGTDQAEEVLRPDEPAVAEKIDPEAPWQRLSWRMLLVDPLGSLTRLLPLFLISLWLGSNRSNYWFETVVISLVVLAGLLRWLSTSYQVGRTHIILKKGFFSRQVVTVARHRIRSVDTESDLFHRVMRVSILEVGTGRADAGKSGAERFRLNAIDTALVDPLRDELLAHRRALDPTLSEEDEEQWGSKYGEDIARWRITWARFAPFSFIGFGVLFSLWFLTWQMGDMHDRIMDLAVVEGTVDRLDSLGPPWAFVGKAIAVWMVAGVLAVITYAIRYGKYALTDHGQLLYVQNGILRRKHQALDKARLRGVELRLPVYLRMLGGGRLEPIMTGTKKGAAASTLLPQAPIGDVRRVAIRILGDETPVTVGLRRHPWKAARGRVHHPVPPRLRTVRGRLGPLGDPGRPGVLPRPVRRPDPHARPRAAARHPGDLTRVVGRQAHDSRGRRDHRVDRLPVGVPALGARRNGVGRDPRRRRRLLGGGHGRRRGVGPGRGVDPGDHRRLEARRRGRRAGVTVDGRPAGVIDPGWPPTAG
jgi:putative membrane protein